MDFAFWAAGENPGLRKASGLAGGGQGGVACRDVSGRGWQMEQDGMLPGFSPFQRHQG